MQPNIESVKSLAFAEFIKGPPPLKLAMDAKSFFKPFNPKLRAFQISGK